MALVVQSESSPRICQPCHHFIHSSHAYHFPDTFSCMGQFCSCLRVLAFAVTPTWVIFPPNIHIAVALLPFRSSSSPQREMSDYIFSPVQHWVSHSLFPSLSVLIKEKTVEFLLRKMEILINDSEKTSQPFGKRIQLEYNSTLNARINFIWIRDLSGKNESKQILGGKKHE